MKTFINKSLIILSFSLLSGCIERENSILSYEGNKNEVKVVELSRFSDYNSNELGVYSAEFSALNDYTLRNKLTKYREKQRRKNNE